MILLQKILRHSCMDLRHTVRLTHAQWCLQATVEWLLKMGAVYYCPVHPPPSKCNIKLTEEQTARVASIHQEGIALHGPNVCFMHMPTPSCVKFAAAGISRDL